MSQILAVMGSLTVPATLKQRVLLYHTFLSVHNIYKGAYDDLFAGLSKNLARELKLYLFESLVEKAPFFQDVPPSVVMQMVMAFEEEVFAPGDLIIRKGDVGAEVFFIIKGSCEVFPDDYS